MLHYRKADLFKNLVSGAIIAHACNAQGVWGSGFAKQCKDRYPNAFNSYRTFCKSGNYESVIGQCAIVGVDREIACLITSEFYGKYRDTTDQILEATRKAIEMFTQMIPEKSVVFSPKINSGLFGVPWLETVQIINPIITQRKIDWVVFEL